MPKFTQTIAGISEALDTGRGQSVELRWNEAIPTVSQSNSIYYLIYCTRNRIDILASEPLFITNVTTITIGDLVNSYVYHFHVKAFEVSDSDWDINELNQISAYLYVYPTTTLSVDITLTDSIIPINSIDNFPLSGVVTIDSEVIEYSSIQTTPYTALVLSSPLTQRGAKGTTAAAHDYLSVVSLYTGTKDGNTVIQPVTPTINYPYNQNVDGYGNPADGYGPRMKTDFVTTDFSVADSKVNFPPFDYCGYHRTDPEKYFKGVLCGTYAGGEYDGMRGFNLYERNFGNLEVMIQQTGEQVILLQRLWTGEQCPCINTRRGSQYARCKICYGTGIIGGFTQYVNPRNPTNGKIYVRFSPKEEDLNITEPGLMQEYQPNAWTLPFPNIKDRDWIVRYDERGNEMWRYEVLNATRNKLFYSTIGKQDLVLKRENKTDIIYQFPVT